MAGIEMLQSGAVIDQRAQLRGRDAHEVVHDVFVSLIERPEQYAGRTAPLQDLAAEIADVDAIHPGYGFLS